MLDVKDLLASYGKVRRFKASARPHERTLTTLLGPTAPARPQLAGDRQPGALAVRSGSRASRAPAVARNVAHGIAQVPEGRGSFPR